MDRNESYSMTKVDTQERATQTERQVLIPTEFDPEYWRQLNLEPISDISVTIEKEVGRLIYKRILKKCLAARVANDIQCQHIIEHNEFLICLSRKFLGTLLNDFDLSKIRSIVLIVNQKQLRAEPPTQNAVDKALFISHQMIPKWKVRSFRVGSNTTVKTLLDHIDLLMKSHIVFDLKLSMKEIEKDQPRELLIWAKCITHKSINCKNSAGLYASEYPKISTFC